MTMKVMNFKDKNHLIPIDNFKDHYVLVFDSISMQDATVIYQYPELVQFLLFAQRHESFGKGAEETSFLEVVQKKLENIAGVGTYIKLYH